MNEIKSSEAKIKKKPESNEIARSVGSFSGWGGKSREFRLETLKHWDPPEGCVGWRQPHREMVRKCFLLLLSSKWRRKQHLGEFITTAGPRTSEASVSVTCVLKSPKVLI